MRHNLNNLMVTNSLTQAELGRRTGIAQPTINRMLHNVTEEPSFSTMLKLANYFNVRVETLYESSEEYTYTEEVEDKVISVPVSKTITVEIKIT